jgi:hypothetical protein
LDAGNIEDYFFLVDLRLKATMVGWILNLKITEVLVEVADKSPFLRLSPTKQ